MAHSRGVLASLRAYRLQPSIRLGRESLVMGWVGVAFIGCLEVQLQR